jgi:hypothetical protein
MLSHSFSRTAQVSKSKIAGLPNPTIQSMHTRLITTAARRSTDTRVPLLGAYNRIDRSSTPSFRARCSTFNCENSKFLPAKSIDRFREHAAATPPTLRRTVWLHGDIPFVFEEIRAAQTLILFRGRDDRTAVFVKANSIRCAAMARATTQQSTQGLLTYVAVARVKTCCSPLFAMHWLTQTNLAEPSGWSKIHIFRVLSPLDVTNTGYSNKEITCTHTHTLNLQSSMFSATAPTDTYFTRQKRCRCYRSIVCIFDDGDELLLGQVPHRDLPACRTGGQSRSLIRSEANRCHSTTMRM